jgi:hypothetical protein
MEVGTIRGSTGEVTARLRPSGFNRHTFLVAGGRAFTYRSASSFNDYCSIPTCG